MTNVSDIQKCIRKREGEGLEKGGGWYHTYY